MERARTLTHGQRVGWRIAQAIVWTAGLAIVLALLFRPQLGIHAFWNVLIPVAPAVFVFVPGFWRNVCPLGTSGLLPRHLGLSRGRKLSIRWQALLSVTGLLTLYLVVPLRHAVLNTSGPATAITILVLTAVAILIGSQVEARSGWCSGMCPVHHVEKLYGSRPITSFGNAHCHDCQQCVDPCPDSIASFTPVTRMRTRPQAIAGKVMVGSFAGFVWGWAQVPDYGPGAGWSHLASIYAWPIGGALTTLALFVALDQLLSDGKRAQLVRVFAALAVITYYWFRVPELVGFGPASSAGMLMDLRGTLPDTFPVWSRVTTTTLFVWWMIGRTPISRSWSLRPPMSVDTKQPQLPRRA